MLAYGRPASMRCATEVLIPRTDPTPIRTAKPPVDFSQGSNVASAREALMSGVSTTTP